MLASTMQPQVQLHPQASRNPQPHDPFQPPPPSVNTPSPLAATPFFPALESLMPSTSTTTTATRTTSTGAPTPRALSRQNTASAAPRPAHGLVGLDAARYPRYSNAKYFPDIRVLSAREYAELEDAHSRIELPEKVLFPWSHGGADIAHTPATQYFGFPRGSAAKTPSTRMSRLTAISTSLHL
ncbi:hypothetical protein JCM3770_001645 [Rhodotorula araucariae]